MGIQNHRIAGTTGRKMCKDRTFNIIYRISFVLGIERAAIDIGIDFARDELAEAGAFQNASGGNPADVLFDCTGHLPQPRLAHAGAKHGTGTGGWGVGGGYKADTERSQRGVGGGYKADTIYRISFVLGIDYGQ